MSLATYTQKRDFSRTKEPAARKVRGRGKGCSFVIQKHDASRLHYDFRLEMGGTLKSWAVPKGMPFAKGEKHLAVQVEDHPLDYARFEGIIPQGEYGGGTVMVWDVGTFESLGGDPEKDLAAGKLHLQLNGKKLQGEWTLVRTRRESEKAEWLLIKTGADLKPVSKKRDDESILTGRKMAQIARERDAEWRDGGRKAAAPLRFVPAMKATLMDAPPREGDWQYELKFDGYRALALKDGDDIQLFSLNAKDFGARFPEIRDALAQLPVKRAAMDGEIVALDAEGRSSFSLLQGLGGKDRPPLAFYAFDLLHLDGEDFTPLPLAQRRARLEQIMRRVKEPLRYSSEIAGDPQRLVEEVCKRRLEGVIGKRTDSPYEAGARSRSWIKLKCVAEQEMVIGGFTAPEGARKYFGALLVGVYESGKLKFAGKVGTGFDGAALRSLHRKMEALRQKACPFANLPAKTAGRWSQNITPAEMKRCSWIQPTLVCQVRFTEWTPDGKLRHPVFLGLREDKAASEVVREKPQA